MKKGFTLVEVLAIIILLGVIITFVVPAYTKYSNSTKEKLYDTKVDTIENAAKLYAKDMYDEGETKTSVSVRTLLSEGYLDSEDNCSSNNSGEDYCDPRDNSTMTGKTVTLTLKNYDSGRVSFEAKID